MSEEPARRAITDWAMGFFRGKLVCAAARLELADHLSEATASAAELARRTGVDPAALRRLLRALAAIGIVDELADGRFSLTPLGAPLRRHGPDSVWASVIFWADLISDSWTYLPEAVRAGDARAARPELEREGVALRWSREPDPASIFNSVFAARPVSDELSYVRAYGFPQDAVVCDLGGGAGGALISAVLGAHPSITGMLVDRPDALRMAKEALTQAGLVRRCDFAPADLLEFVPKGADIYMMKYVLHGYGDEQASAILRNCRSALPTNGCLLIIEAVLPDRIEGPDPAIEELLMSDINMLAVTGGQERSRAEWSSLLVSGGFTISRWIAVPDVARGVTARWITEARPAV